VYIALRSTIALCKIVLYSIIKINIKHYPITQNRAFSSTTCIPQNTFLVIYYLPKNKPFQCKQTLSMYITLWMYTKYDLSLPNPNNPTDKFLTKRYKYTVSPKNTMTFKSICTKNPTILPLQYTGTYHDIYNQGNNCFSNCYWTQHMQDKRHKY